MEGIIQECTYETTNLKTKQVLQEKQCRAQESESASNVCWETVLLIEFNSERDGRQLAAQLILVQRCARSLPRLLTRGHSVLTMAKVLTISRLLCKNVDQQSDGSGFVKAIKERLTPYRRRLLSRIDRLLADHETDISRLLDAIWAYCIATTSSFIDAVHHFQALRFERITLLTDNKRQKWPFKVRVGRHSHARQVNVIDGLECFIQTVHSTKQLLVEQSAQTFRQVKDQFLLQAPDVMELETLGLAQVRHCIPAELLNFVPWVTYDSAKESEHEVMINSWSESAFGMWYDKFASGLRGSNVSELLTIRTKILRVWLLADIPASCRQSSKSSDFIQRLFLDAIESKLRESIIPLYDVAKMIAKSLNDDSGAELQSIGQSWDRTLVRAPLGKDVSPYVRQLLSHQLGDSTMTKRLQGAILKQTSFLSNFAREIDGLRRIRWVDIIGEAQGGERISDAMIEAIQKDDPSYLEHQIMQQREDLIGELQKIMQRALWDLLKDESEQTNSFELRVLCFLRVIRIIDQQVFANMPKIVRTPLMSNIPLLHNKIAAIVASDVLCPAANFWITSGSSRRLRDRRKAKLKTLYHLWSGSPPLPTSTSPSTVNFLQRLTTRMAGCGTDIWCPGAVQTLKRAIKVDLVDGKWLAVRETSAEDVPQQSSHSPAKRESQVLNNDNGGLVDAKAGGDKVISLQILFDAMYLHYALKGEANESIENDGHDGSNDYTYKPGFSEDIVHFPQQEAAALNFLTPEVMETLDSRASQYWKRTHLFFGLLAS